MADMAGETEGLPERKFGWWDMFLGEDEDPRADGGWENTERAVLTGFLSDRRLTLELKCAGLGVRYRIDFGACFVRCADSRGRADSRRGPATT